MGRKRDMTGTRPSPAARGDAPRRWKLAPGLRRMSRNLPETAPKPPEAVSAGARIRIGGAEADLTDGRVRAPDYAARAVAADPDDPSVLLQAGWAASLDGDLEAAGRDIRRAVELAPNDADILAVAAWSGPGSGGIFADANAWADRALALNPAAPGWYKLAKGTAAFGAGDDEAAVAAFRAAPPGFAERAFFLAAAQGMLGDAGAARAAADELRAMLPGFDLDRYVQTWQDPDFQQRLRDGATRAGL